MQGLAFHEGKSAFYKRGSEQAAITAVKKCFSTEAKKLEYPSTSGKSLLNRVLTLLNVWIERQGKFDLLGYNILLNEQEYKVPLTGTPYHLTFRIDQVLQSKADGLIFILETKTSSFSHRITFEGVKYGDQATLYLWALPKVTKYKPYGVLPDIAYWSKTTSNPANIQTIRAEIVMRSDNALEAFELGAKQILHEIAQKVTALKTNNYLPAMLFPRNTYYCVSYGTLCPYADICCEDWNSKSWKHPSSLKIDRGIKNLGGLVYDRILDS